MTVMPAKYHAPAEVRLFNPRRILKSSWSRTNHIEREPLLSTEDTPIWIPLGAGEPRLPTHVLLGRFPYNLFIYLLSNSSKITKIIIN